MSSEVVTPFRLRNPFQSCHVHGFDLSIAVLEELCVLSCSTPNSLRCGMAMITVALRKSDFGTWS